MAKLGSGYVHSFPKSTVTKASESEQKANPDAFLCMLVPSLQSNPSRANGSEPIDFFAWPEEAYARVLAVHQQ